MKALWWILGLAAAGTGVYFISQKLMTPEPGPVTSTDLCINDLPEPVKTQVLEAIKANDDKKLSSYATQATAQGWNCAAGEINKIVADIINQRTVKISETATNRFFNNPQTVLNRFISSPVKDSTEKAPVEKIELHPAKSFG